ncbi:MAG: hypothetical protein Q9220_003512 [cf. Caloplaca sp. 1 TL-2023]
MDLSSLGVPIDPSAFADLQYEIEAVPSPHAYNSSQLYFNLLVTEILFWRRPDVVPITETQIFRTRQYPSLAIVVERVLYESRFSTAAVAAALDLLRYRQLLGFLSPEIYTFSLTTRGPPFQPVGKIENVFLPEPMSDKNVTTGSLLTIPAGAVTIKYSPRGQTPGYPIIIPLEWLYRFWRLTYTVFSKFSSTDPIVRGDPSFPQTLILDAGSTKEQGLTFEITSASVPEGKSVPVWEELVVGIAMVLEEVVREQRFEPFDADIYKDDWLAAKVRLFYQWSATATA